MPGFSETQQGLGEMDISFYLQKLEQTCMVEDPDTIYNYNRASLRDTRCEAPALESDQPRRDTYAMDFINLRYGGARVNTSPELSDGSFLDFDGLNRDPRGNALGPDFKQLAKQSKARGKFIKFYSDADNSIVSEGRTPQAVMRQNRAQFYNVKDRLKIFDESMDSRGIAGSQFKITTTEECLQKQDYRNPDMQDEVCYNRTNKVNDLSKTDIGYRTTTDNRFKIAQYGQIRRPKNMKDSDWTKNRSNAIIDNDTPISFADQNLPKSVALKMIDLSKKRYSDMLNGKNIAFEESKNQKIRNQKKITPSDLNAMERNDTHTTQATAAHAIINGDRSQHITGAMLKPQLDSNRMKKVDVSPIIAKYMASTNRKMTTEKQDDLRDQIIQSATFNGILNSQSNKTANQQDVKNELLWESIANFEKGRSMKVANYGRTAASTMVRGPKNHDIDWEEYKKEQKMSGQRRGNIQNPDMYNMDVIMYDNDAGMEAVGTKLIGSMGSKYTRTYLDKGDTEYETLSEVAARN